MDDISAIIELYDNFLMKEFMAQSEGVQDPNILTMREIVKEKELDFWGITLAKGVFDEALYLQEVELAEQGDVVAQTNLAYIWKHRYNEADHKAAFEFLKKAVSQGYRRAINGLGMCYLDGVGCEQSREKAIELFEKGYKLGCPAATCNYALLKSNKQERRVILQRLGDNGMVDAYVYLAKELWYKRAEEAPFAWVHWLRLAWEGGKNVVELMVRDGMLKSQETCAAIGYYKGFTLEELTSLAEKYPDMKTYLGYTYQEGILGMYDYNKSFVLYRESALAGECAAQVLLGECYYYGRGVAENKRKAYLWFKHTAKRGSRQGLGWLAVALYKGEGCNVDFNKSFEYELKAAQLDNLDALGNIAVKYDGLFKGPEINHNKAMDLYWLLTLYGRCSKISHLANCYYENGDGGKDFCKFVALCASAAIKGCKESQLVIESLSGIPCDYWAQVHPERMEAELDDIIVEMYENRKSRAASTMES